MVEWEGPFALLPVCIPVPHDDPDFAPAAAVQNGHADRSRSRFGAGDVFGEIVERCVMSPAGSDDSEGDVEVRFDVPGGLNDIMTSAAAQEAWDQVGRERAALRMELFLDRRSSRLAVALCGLLGLTLLATVLHQSGMFGKESGAMPVDAIVGLCPRRELDALSPLARGPPRADDNCRSRHGACAESTDRLLRQCRKHERLSLHISVAEASTPLADNSFTASWTLTSCHSLDPTSSSHAMSPPLATAMRHS